MTEYSKGMYIGYHHLCLARQFGSRKRNFNGEQFWVRGYAVSMVGFEEEHIRSYILHQEQPDVSCSYETSDS